MNLLNIAKTRNDDFGLRQWYPWSSKQLRAPWTNSRITRKEKRYIFSIMEDVFDWYEMWIERIENPYLWGRYALRYEEMRATRDFKHVEEEIVVHATSEDNAYKIADTNFNWRLAKRCRYGRGVSFAQDAEYAEAQASESDVYMISGILVANSEYGHYGTKIPSYSVDTTTNRQKSVYVKYNDNEYYPYYIVS